MYAVEWVVGLALLGFVIGAVIGWLAARRRPLGDARARELEACAQELETRARQSEQAAERFEAELDAARREQERYREQVVDEFSETARKFKTLNAAYGDLHRQLAVSSSALCGDMVDPRLEPPRAEALAESPAEDDATEHATEASDGASLAEPATDATDAPDAPEDAPAAPEGPSTRVNAP